MSCIFCEIAARHAEASWLFEDDAVSAFLDIQPITPGHALIVPKRHAASLAELDPASGIAMWLAGSRVAAAIRRSGVRCEGIDLLLADGAAAGQEVFHVHLHVIPRFVGDGFGFTFPEGYRSLPPRAELDRVAREVQAAL